MKKYIAPSLELQILSSEDIMTTSDILFGGLGNLTNYIGETLDFSGIYNK